MSTQQGRDTTGCVFPRLAAQVRSQEPGGRGVHLFQHWPVTARQHCCTADVACCAAPPLSATEPRARAHTTSHNHHHHHHHTHTRSHTCARPEPASSSTDPSTQATSSVRCSTPPSAGCRAGSSSAPLCGCGRGNSPNAHAAVAIASATAVAVVGAREFPSCVAQLLHPTLQLAKHSQQNAAAVEVSRLRCRPQVAATRPRDPCPLQHDWFAPLFAVCCFRSLLGLAQRACSCLHRLFRPHGVLCRLPGCHHVLAGGAFLLVPPWYVPYTRVWRRPWLPESATRAAQRGQRQSPSPRRGDLARG